MIVKFEGIDWDVGDEEEYGYRTAVEAGLPFEAYLEFDEDEDAEWAESDDYAIDRLSEEYGWLINGVEKIRRFKEAANEAT